MGATSAELVPVMELVTVRPRPRLRSLVAGYHGYRIEGAEPGVHRGLPSRYLTFIVTLDGTVDLAAMPDPAQPPASFTTLAGGLHAGPVLISHNGRQHGIQLSLTPLGPGSYSGCLPVSWPVPSSTWARCWGRSRVSSSSG